MKIRTNNHWRLFLCRSDVPQEVLESQFGWMKQGGEWPEDDYTDGFLQYKGHWYHLADFMHWTCPDPDTDPLKAWHGYCSHSYFSGILIRVSDDGEQYQVATYIG